VGRCYRGSVIGAWECMIGEMTGECGNIGLCIITFIFDKPQSIIARLKYTYSDLCTCVIDTCTKKNIYKKMKPTFKFRSPKTGGSVSTRT